MNIIRRIVVSVALILCVGHLFADRQIGTIPNFVEDESDILEVGVVNNDVPVLCVREEREGFVSTIKEYFVMYGKEKIGPFDEVRLPYYFSPDGKTLAYCAEIDGKWYLYVGKEKIGPFDNVGSFEFSPDGKTLAYEAEIDGKIYLYVGKEKIGPFDFVESFKFSPDGKTLAYSAKIDEKWYLYVGRDKIRIDDIFNEKNKTFYLTGDESFYLTFSSDEKTLKCSTTLYYGKKLIFNSQVYTGSICAGKVVYIKDGKIMLRE